VSSAARLRLVSDLQLPDVWRVQDLGAQEKVLSSGHAPLDAVLPGGGWPRGNLVELLQDQPGQHLWQLLLPALVQSTCECHGPVVLVDCPFDPFGSSLQAHGLPLSRLLKIKADKPKSRLWAAEQALRCADIAAVLAWLPQAKGAELRRLQIAAQQQDQLLFVVRPTLAQRDSTPARLRLLVQGLETMELHILKRRGPPVERPLHLPAYPPRLRALLDARKRKGPILPSPKDRSHVLDRTLALA
jgi:protein ImuA